MEHLSTGLGPITMTQGSEKVSKNLKTDFDKENSSNLKLYCSNILFYRSLFIQIKANFIKTFAMSPKFPSC